MLGKFQFIAEMPNAGRGAALRGVSSLLSILSVSRWRSPCPPHPRSHRIRGWGEARRAPALGRRLQLRAAASRWNFLTNARPGRGARRGEARALPLSRSRRGSCGDAWAVIGGEGRRTVQVEPGGFP